MNSGQVTRLEACGECVRACVHAATFRPPSSMLADAALTRAAARVCSIMCSIVCMVQLDSAWCRFKTGEKGSTNESQLHFLFSCSCLCTASTRIQQSWPYTTGYQGMLTRVLMLMLMDRCAHSTRPKNGVYPKPGATGGASSARGGGVGGAAGTELSARGVAPSAARQAAPSVPVAKEDRWCKPWEDHKWPV